MIVEYDPRGEITHIRFDPVPNGVKEMLDEMQISYVEIVSEKIFGPQIDPDTFEPVFDDDAQPVIEQHGLLEPDIHIHRHYVDTTTRVVLERPTFDVPERIEFVADGHDEAKISGLPDPCLIKVEGEEMTVEGGEIVLTSDMPANYRIELIQWPYIPATVEVIAHAPATT